MKTSTDYLNALADRVKLLHQSFSLWKTLVKVPNENEEAYDRFANRYPKLHHTLYAALEYHMIVGLHAILVKDSEGVTITKLLNKIAGDGVRKLKNGQTVKDLISAFDVDLSKLKTLRDKFFAHQDKTLLNGPFEFSLNEYDSLLTAATKVLDPLSHHLTGGPIDARDAANSVESEFLKLLTMRPNRSMPPNPYLHLNRKTVEFDLAAFQPRRLRPGDLYTTGGKLKLKFDEIAYPNGSVFWHELSESEISRLKPHPDKNFDFLLEDPV